MCIMDTLGLTKSVQIIKVCPDFSMHVSLYDKALFGTIIISMWIMQVSLFQVS